MANYATSPLNIGAVRWTHEDDIRIKKRAQRHHPKDFETSYASYVPWSELVTGDSSVSFEEIGRELRDLEAQNE